MRINEAHAQVDFIGQGVRLLLVHTVHSPAGVTRSIATNVTFQQHEPGAQYDGLVLETDAAQALFEELWAQGFRSVHDRGGADRLDAARKEHIDDLRKAAKLK